MNTERETITDNLTEKLETVDWGEQFGLIHAYKEMCLEDKTVIILGLKEAPKIYKRLGRFINRNGGKVK